MNANDLFNQHIQLQISLETEELARVNALINAQDTVKANHVFDRVHKPSLPLGAVADNKTAVLLAGFNTLYQATARRLGRG